MLSAICFTSDIIGFDKIAVIPFCGNDKISLLKSYMPISSSSFVGLSRINRAELFKRAIAIRSLCFIPIENCADLYILFSL